MTMEDLPSTPLGAIVRSPRTTSESTRVARLLWLRSLFGDSGTDGRLESLIGRMTEFFLPRGKELYVAGTSSDSLYFIVEGVVLHGEFGYTRFQSGDVLGFVDGMLERPHKHTATVEQDAVILRLKLDDWMDHLEDHFLEARHMVSATAGGMDPTPDTEPLVEDGLPQDLGPVPQPDDSTGHLVRRLLAVKSCLLFRRAGIQSIAQIVRRSDELLLPSGSALMPSQISEGLYVLLSGSVRCTMGDTRNTTSFEATQVGALLGSMSALLRVPATFDIMALEDSVILYFDPEDYFDVMEDHFDVTRSAMAYFALRTEARNGNRDTT